MRIFFSVMPQWWFRQGSLHWPGPVSGVRWKGTTAGRPRGRRCREVVALRKCPSALFELGCADCGGGRIVRGRDMGSPGSSGLDCPPLNPEQLMGFAISEGVAGAIS